MTSLEMFCRQMRARFMWMLAVVIFTIMATAEAARAQPTPNDQTPLPAGALLRMGNGHVGQVAGLGLLDNGKTLLTSAKDDTLRLWDLESGKLTGQIVVPHSRPKSILLFATRPWRS